jgi:hypothetical protein
MCHRATETEKLVTSSKTLLFFVTAEVSRAVSSANYKYTAGTMGTIQNDCRNNTAPHPTPLRSVTCELEDSLFNSYSAPPSL